MPHLIIKLN